MKRLRSSKRGLTFSISPGETYYPGSHFTYEVRSTCIIIHPSKEGSTVSRKKSGNIVKALFDIRSREVREAVASSTYMEMEVREDRIIVRCIRQVRSKIISIEKVLKEFSVPSTTLDMAAGLDGQMTIFEYLDSLDSFHDTFTEADSETLRQDLKQVFTVMSLFSGAGMLDWPFYKDPAFQIKFACDYNKDACESYKRNIGDHIKYGDVREVHGNGEPYNLIIGGPSCKPFSASNRRKMLASHEDVDLVNEYIRITKENAPDVFVIENVPQFLTSNDGEYLARVMNHLGRDYQISSIVVCDSNVGGYTLRKRAIVIGSKIGKIFLPDIKIHPVKTVKEALSKVSEKWFNFHDLTKSRPDTVRKMAMVRPGHNFKDIPEYRDNELMHSDRYYRLAPDRPSPTIVNWRKLPLIHPTENRTLTVAEASALMGFDSEFTFLGSLDSRQQQCGNGCPFSIGKLVKNTVKKALQNYYQVPVMA